MDRYQYFREQIEFIEESLKKKLCLLDGYANRAMVIQATSSPVGKILSFLRKLFSKAAEGPELYKPRGEKSWARPQIVAGAGCIILGLFLLLGVVYLGVLAVEHLVAGGGAAAIVVALVIYYAMVKKAQQQKIGTLRDEEFTDESTVVST